MNSTKILMCLFIILITINTATAVQSQLINIASVTDEQTLSYDDVVFTTFKTSSDNYITEMKLTIGSQTNSNIWQWLNQNFAVSAQFTEGFTYTALYDTNFLYTTRYSHNERFNGTINGTAVDGFVFQSNATKFLLFKPKPEIYIKYDVLTGLTTYTFEPTLILTFGGTNKQGDFLENSTDFYSGMPTQNVTLQSTQPMHVEFKIRTKDTITVAEQANSLSPISKFIYKLLSALISIITLGKVTDNSVLLYFLLFFDTLIYIMIFFIELFFFKFYLILMYIIILGNFWCANRAINLHSLLQEYQQYYKSVFRSFKELFTYMYDIVLYLIRLIRG